MLLLPLKMPSSYWKRIYFSKTDRLKTEENKQSGKISVRLNNVMNPCIFFLYPYSINIELKISIKVYTITRHIECILYVHLFDIESRVCESLILEPLNDSNPSLIHENRFKRKKNTGNKVKFNPPKYLYYHDYQYRGKVQETYSFIIYAPTFIF